MRKQHLELIVFVRVLFQHGKLFLQQYIARMRSGA